MARNWITTLAGGALGLALLLIALAGPMFSSEGRAATNCSAGDPSLDGEEQQFLTLINAYRAQNNLTALSTNGILNQAAAWMGYDLAANGYFSHTDSLGRAPYARAVACGYPSGAGENIAGGTAWDTAQEAFDAWKASPGHNANMLGQYYTEIGIARHYDAASPYKWYWVTEFGTQPPSGGGYTPPTNTPTPPPTATPTRTPSPVPPTATPTRTPSPIPPTATATRTASPTATAPSPSPSTPVPTATQPPATATAPRTPSPTASPSASATRTPSPTARPSLTPPTQAPGTPAPPSSLPLFRGANLVTWPGESQPPSQVFNYPGAVNVVYSYDASAREWRRYIPGAPGFVNNLGQLRSGWAYWVIATEPNSVALTR